ncbi:MAG: FG-GAP-like repeat-containing protein [Myxococcota bacterium]
MRVLPLLLLLGCYDHFVRGDRDGSVDPTEDAALRDAGADGFVAIDGGIDAPDGVDGGIDGGFDAGFDAGADAGRPPTPRPPNPATCRIEPEIFPFDAPVQEYRWPSGPIEVHSDAVHVSATPLVIDLEPDGEDLEPVLVFTSYPPLGRTEEPGILRIVDPRTNTTISYPPTSADRGVLEATTNLAAGDIDGDGRNEIVGIGAGGGTWAFRSDGTLLWQSFWPRLNDLGGGLGFFSSIGGGPAIADLDADGRPEIVVGRMALAGDTGEVLWDAEDTYGMGINTFIGPLPCVADLDGDGLQEVISGNTLFDDQGDEIWQSEVPDGLCAVADVWPGVPGPDVILVSNGFLRILDRRDGTQVWVRDLEGRSIRRVGGAPTVADFDGDGRPEIGVAYAAAYGVYDVECEDASDEGCIGRGLLWKADTSDASSAGTGSSVFDFNGDGRSEVIYNDEQAFRVYDGLTGRVEFQEPNSSRTRSENPTIADIDNDGDAEIIFSANAEARFIFEWWTDPGVEIWGDRRGRWVGSRRIWNQHAYHIDNVNEDGSIPRRPNPSWEGHNSFRQNFRETLDVLVVPDLWGGEGSFECLGGSRARLNLEIFNYGLERAGTVVVGIYRGRPSSGGVRVGEVRTTRPLLPRGDSEVLTFDVDVFPPFETYYGVIDEEETVFECREGNNQMFIWEPTCP